jgi:hypothetical protein
MEMFDGFFDRLEKRVLCGQFAECYILRYLAFADVLLHSAQK